MRVKVGRIYDVICQTDIYINPKYWSSKTGKVKQVAEFEGKINLPNKLKALKDSIEIQLQNALLEQKPINKEWLKLNKLMQRFKKKIYLI